MIDIEKLKPLIVEALLPLKPDKIILFGSYAYGNPNENSDIDLFLIKDDLDDLDTYEVKAHMQMYELIRKHHIGFDVLSASSKYVNNRDDYFYKVDILEKGKVLHERKIR
ncbi:MAG: nucleotidyltransferase domain-containing protein [Sulfurovum sp.]|nr:nucleotidyltransferase domain-containing protein [Sulfurovum sp.]